jgi:hypothetical protein
MTSIRTAVTVDVDESHRQSIPVTCTVMQNLVARLHNHANAAKRVHPPRHIAKLQLVTDVPKLTG